MLQFNNTGSPQEVFEALFDGFYVVAVETTGFANLASDASPSVYILDTNAGPNAIGHAWLFAGDKLILSTNPSGSYSVSVRGSRFASDELAP